MRPRRSLNKMVTAAPDHSGTNIKTFIQRAVNVTSVPILVYLNKRNIDHLVTINLSLVKIIKII